LGNPAPEKTSAAGPLSPFFAFYILLGFIVMSQDVSEVNVVGVYLGGRVRLHVPPVPLQHIGADRFVESK
jgi:hypothetical protein